MQTANFPCRQAPPQSPLGPGREAELDSRGCGAQSKAYLRSEDFVGITDNVEKDGEEPDGGVFR